jgi:dTDP-4-amino-4,6-dideoxygalactose transaminase
MKPFPVKHDILAYSSEAMYLMELCRDDASLSSGTFSTRCINLLKSVTGIGEIMLTPSCTTALEMAVRLLGIGPGDEVVLPSFTFPSTANAVLLAGATPVFADITPGTMTLDPESVDRAVTPQTRAIFVVHYAGVSADMDPLQQIANRVGARLIEDAAQGVGASYRGRPLGGIGCLGAYSFHFTKNIFCGEGGALCINDPGLQHRAYVYRDKGTNRCEFLNGTVDHYTWVDLGTSGMMGEIPSAFLLAQLQRRNEVLTRRQTIHETYMAALTDAAAREWICLPEIPDYARSNYHLFRIQAPSAECRSRLMTHLKAAGINATTHFVPLHSSPMGRTAAVSSNLPNTDKYSAGLIRLPFNEKMSKDEVARVAESIGNFFTSAPRSGAAAAGILPAVSGLS